MLNTMKKNLWLLACLIASMIFVSCGDDDDPVVPPSPEPEVDATMMYFINEGSWNVANSASFCSYNTKTNVASLLEEPTAKIGDTPQDMLIVGSKVYGACWGSKGLLIVDVAGEPTSRFVSLNEEVRYLAYKAPYLYISCYGGRILRYDTTNGDTRTLQTSGSNLEGVAILGDKLYACNSYSVDAAFNYTYLNTLITVDLNTFTEGEPITTVTNPNYIVALDGALYVVGFGNYGYAEPYEPYMLAKVDPVARTSTNMESASKLCVWNNKLLYAYSETDWTTYSTTTTFTLYNPASGRKASVSLDSKHLGNAIVYMMEEDPYSNDLYVGVTDNSNTGKIYRFSANTASLGSFSSEGINPSHAVFYKK